MTRLASFLFRLCAGTAFGAQLFFAAFAAQAIFSREVAALPAADPRRRAAADLIGALLTRLDLLTLALCAAAAFAALWLSRRGAGKPSASARRAALPVLLAGFAALASRMLVTPAIRALRAAGATATPRFGQLHAVSSLLLLLELALLLAAVWMAPQSD